MEYFLDRVRTIPSQPRPPVDILISIDGSTQPNMVGAQIMTLVQHGIKSILNETKIDKYHMQMGIMEYSDAVRKPLAFTQNQGIDAIEQASLGLVYSGGQARHDLALKEVEKIFASGRPRIEGIPRVAILIITKNSPNSTKTIEAANILNRNPGIIRFVFVANMMLDANDPEIRAMASKPECKYIFILGKLAEIINFLEEMNEESAQVPVPMSDFYSANSTVKCTLNGERKQLQEKVDRLKGRKFVLRVEGGNATVYFSSRDPEPSSENYEFRATARDNQPGEILISAKDLQNLNQQKVQGVSNRRGPGGGGGGGGQDSSVQIYSSIEGTGTIEFYSEEPRVLQVGELTTDSLPTTTAAGTPPPSTTSTTPTTISTSTITSAILTTPSTLPSIPPTTSTIPPTTSTITPTTSTIPQTASTILPTTSTIPPTTSTIPPTSTISITSTPITTSITSTTISTSPNSSTIQGNNSAIPVIKELNRSDGTKLVSQASSLIAGMTALIIIYFY